MIKLDGSYLEGGGQIVRTALALSVLTGKAFEVNDIRKGRSKPGLKAQHLHCIKALKELCNAETNDVKIGSEYLRFIPGKIKVKNLNIDIGTAGSITLLLQSLLLPCLFAGKGITLKIKGGTDVKWSMPFDYFNNVFVPQLGRFCEDVNVKLLKRGYYPKGGGLVEVKIKPKFSLDNGFEDLKRDALKNNVKINLLDQGKLVQIKGISHASLGLEGGKVAERQTKSAKLSLLKLKVPINIQTHYSDTLSTGSGITLWAGFLTEEGNNIESPIVLGVDCLGEKGKKAELVGKECAEKLIKEINSGGCIDKNLADNLIPFMIFGGEFKSSEISNHTLTNIYTVECFLGNIFDVKKNIIKV